MAGNVFAMEAMTFLTSSLLDSKAGDLRIETAMCKMWATETTWRIADEAMQVRGGRGYETAQSLAGRGEPPIAVERFLRDCRVNTIFEGSSEIMRLFIAREALDPHLKVGGAIFNTQLPMSDRAKAVFSSGKFYAGWYPRQWLPNGAGKIDNLHEAHCVAMSITPRAQANGSHADCFTPWRGSARNSIASNCSFRGSSESRRNCLRSARRVRTRNGCSARVNRPMKFFPLRDYFCRSARMRIDHHFAGTARNADKRGYDLVQDLLAGKHELLRQGIV